MMMMNLNRQTVTLALALALFIAAPRSAAACDPPAASAGLLGRLELGGAMPIDEDYRAEFRRCDDQNIFRGAAMHGWRKCSGDKNNVRALLKLPDGSVLIESKLGLDLDGSWKAWNDSGATDLRATWYQWPRACRGQERDSEGLCQREQVDSEHIPFVVIPIAGPGAHRREFRAKTGIDKGDFGVLVYGSKWVPVFVADGGPYNKLGEASAAALAALGEDRCRRRNQEGFCDRYLGSSIGAGVVTIIFPGSRRPGMTAETAMLWACEAAKQKLGLSGAPTCR